MLAPFAEVFQLEEKVALPVKTKTRGKQVTKWLHLRLTIANVEVLRRKENKTDGCVHVCNIGSYSNGFCFVCAVCRNFFFIIKKSCALLVKHS